MAYLGNQPLLSTMRTVAEGTAYANQTEIPVPGGLVSGLVDVVVNGADLAREDYDDSNGASIKLNTPMVVGSMFKVTAWTPNQTVVNAGGQLETFRNKIINGDFRIWQRGTSLSAAVMALYLADRWVSSSTGSTMAPSRQIFTLGQTAVPGEPAAFHREVIASVAGAGNYAILAQPIESVRTLAGQTATLSFWAKADANKSIAVEFVQSFGTGGSPSAPVTGIAATKLALTSSWQQFKVTVAIPSLSGKTLGGNGDDSLQLNFWMDAGSSYNARTGTLGQQSGTFDFAQVQLEAGAVATQFEQRPYAVEVGLCRRYCIVYPIGTFIGPATIMANNSAYVMFPGTECLRAAPSIVHTGGGAIPRIYAAGGAGNWASYGSVYFNPGFVPLAYNITTPATMVAGQSGMYYSEGQVVILSAEL